MTAPSQLGRRSDMDPNGHINNVAYLAWALEVIPEYICQDYQLTEVRDTHTHIPGYREREGAVRVADRYPQGRGTAE